MRELDLTELDAVGGGNIKDVIQSPEPIGLPIDPWPFPIPPCTPSPGPFGF